MDGGQVRHGKHEESMRLIGIAAFVAFIATIFVANWLLETYGIVPIGFGLMAPAGVFAVGFAFTFRDIIQRTLGRHAVVLAIVIGAACSYLISPAFALASAAAFALSELADFAVYTPLQRRGWIRAVVASNVVGAIVDSALFLWLAFGSLAFIEGQIVGKAAMTLVAVALLAVIRPRFASEPA
jgi:uncharacterized PurR-regulated membrane protein YhhQ (DUF165 family)